VLYGEPSPRASWSTPRYGFLAGAGLAYLVATALLVVGRTVELSSAGLQSLVAFGGLLAVLGSGLLAGGLLLFSHAVTVSVIRRWSS
jgi:uncharacterized membrane protein